MPDTPTQDIRTNAAVLDTLRTRIADTAHGFETMVEKADAAFRPVAEHFLHLHRAHLETLTRMMAGAGQETDDATSVMSWVNDVVISARAAVTGIDRSALSQIRGGEEHVLDAFDDAVAVMRSPEVVGTLTRMRDELRALVHDTCDAH